MERANDRKGKKGQAYLLKVLLPLTRVRITFDFYKRKVVTALSSLIKLQVPLTVA